MSMPHGGARAAPDAVQPLTRIPDSSVVILATQNPANDRGFCEKIHKPKPQEWGLSRDKDKPAAIKISPLPGIFNIREWNRFGLDAEFAAAG